MNLAGCFATERTVINIDDPYKQSQQTKISSPRTDIPQTPPSARTSTTSNDGGLIKIVQNPQVPAMTARNICERRARSEANLAASRYRPSNTRTETSCRQDYFGNFNCTDSTYISGGAAGGVLAGLEQGQLRRQVTQSVLVECLAQLGWTEM